MADIRNVMIVTFTPVQDDAGLSGKVIGKIFGNYQPYSCEVDYATLHDRMVQLVNPKGLPFAAPEMWVEWSHCVEGGGEPGVSVQLLVTYFSDGRAPTVKVVG